MALGEESTKSSGLLIGKTDKIKHAASSSSSNHPQNTTLRSAVLDRIDDLVLPQEPSRRFS